MACAPRRSVFDRVPDRPNRPDRTLLSRRANTLEMKNPIAVLEMALAGLALFMASCSTFESSVEDVNSTKYLEFAHYPVGRGKVFILTTSYLRKEYPGDVEKQTVPVVAEKLRSLGYSIAPTEGEADFVFAIMWGIGPSRDRIESYGGEISTVTDVIHQARGEFLTAKKEQLWSGSVSETWGHASVDAPRLAGLLMEKFPN
jgi:hypothetical protein